MKNFTSKTIAKLRREIMKPGYYHDRAKKMHKHIEYWREFRYIDCVDGDENTIEYNKAIFRKEFPIALRKYNYYKRKEREQDNGNY